MVQFILSVSVHFVDALLLAAAPIVMSPPSTPCLIYNGGARLEVFGNLLLLVSLCICEDLVFDGVFRTG